MDLEQRQHRLRGQEDHWIPLSDLMTGLMMIFMLVAIVFMIQVRRDEVKIVASRERVKDIALHYSDMRAQLYRDLASEFKDDLGKWHARITPDLSIRFEEPSIQFDTGSAVVKDTFKAILDGFFPRYVKILYSQKYHDAVQEVRIEGHTSTLWKGLDNEQAYYENMQLSQERTRAVLMYVFSLPKVRSTQILEWLLSRVTANGLSSSGWLALPNGNEDIVRSQRVEFKVRTNADSELQSILKALSE
jgi:outer membrane protein OmpA-like peptidoglycan-associated protein